MGRRRQQEVGFILWEGGVLELGGKIGKKLRSPSSSVAGEEARRERGEMAMSLWSSDLSKQFGEAGRVATESTHSPTSSEKVLQRLLGPGCFITCGIDLGTP